MNTPSSAPPSGGSGPCHHCGRDLAAGAWFCSECERYQPSPPGSTDPSTRICRHCGEWMPAGAGRCNRCEGFQSGIPALLPRSSATVAAASALLSLVVLLISTLAGVTWWPRSDTRLTFVGTGADFDSLLFFVDNRGNRPSTLGSAWVRFAANCDWPEDRCRSLQAGAQAAPASPEPPTGVLETHPEDAFPFAEPGRRTVRFTHLPDAKTLAADDRPGESCDGLGDRIPALKICVAVEVLEKGADDFRCDRMPPMRAADHPGYVLAKTRCDPM